MGRRKLIEEMPPLGRVILAVLAAGSAGCALFGGIYGCTGAPWALTPAITAGMLAYHAAIRLLAPVLLTAFTRRQYDCRSRWFRPKTWETRLYGLLRVKRWKGRAPTYNPQEFSLERHTLEEVINSMCHAEAVHELIAAMSVLSLLFAVPFGAFWVFFTTGLLSALLDSAFAVIQRYNRPRLVRLAERRSRQRGYSQMT